MSESKEMGPDQEILPSRDKRYLEVAAERLIQQFIQDFPEKLPDALILPDVSARPLEYLLKPIFTHVAAKRRLPAPLFIFFKVIRPHPMGKGTVASEEMQYERAKEIVQKLLNKGIPNPKLVVFDDYMSGRATTLREVRRAFNDPTLPAYVLLVPNQHVDEYTRFGRLDPFADPIFHGESSGFHYRRNTDPRKSTLMGVYKTPEGLYSKPIGEDRNPEAMRILRDEMKRIGQKIAANL